MLYVRAALLSAVYTCSRIVKSAVCTVKKCASSLQKESLFLSGCVLWIFLLGRCDIFLPSVKINISFILPSQSFALTDWICFRLSIISQSLWVVLHFIHSFPSLHLSLSLHMLFQLLSPCVNSRISHHIHTALNPQPKKIRFEGVLYCVSQKKQIWVTISMLKNKLLGLE